MLIDAITGYQEAVFRVFERLSQINIKVVNYKNYGRDK